MAYVPVPKDLTRIKTKVVFNLTKRQLLCFGGGAAIGLPLFFLLRDVAGATGAAFVMIIVMLPCFLLAVYERNGQPLEKIIKHIILTRFINSKERPYKTDNFYSVLERQNNLDKEVQAIVTGKNE